MAMPSLGALVEDMVAAAKGSLGKDFPKAKDFAKPELSKLAQSLLDIAELSAAGKISPQEATALLEIHRNTTRIVLLTIKGLGLIAVENAINAALGAVRDTVNGAIGFALV